MRLFNGLLVSATFALALNAPIFATEEIPTEHAQKTLEIYTRIVEVESSKNLGNVPEIANYLAQELIEAGIPKADVEVMPLGETAALIARYRGDGSSGKAPILFLGHMDVVEALPEDWQRPPFTLTHDENYYYARVISLQRTGNW